MKTYIQLNNENRQKTPSQFNSDDNRNPENIVRFFLEKYTKKNDTVFDPFGGLGTTMLVAEKMGRTGFCVEYDEKRAAYIKSYIKSKENVIQGNSLELKKYNLPQFDFCFTSPPYMPKNSKKNPFTCCATKGDYKNYLKDLKKIFSLVKLKMKKNAFVVIEVSNLKGKDVTMLAWDIAREVSQVFHFEGEMIVCWQGKKSYNGNGIYGYGYDHSYCLVFQNKNK